MPTESKIRHVVIGIQARSTSSRFPRKIFEMIGGKSVLRHVIDACDKAAFYMNRHTAKDKLMVSYAVVCPFKDELKKEFSGRAIVIEGPENDVLARYHLLANKMDADFVVRITADCPLIPSYLITKHIKIAAAADYDYCSNVDESCRTAIDGYDVEVISRRAIEWAHVSATDPSHREHVTPILRSGLIPPDFRIGHVVGFLNQSHVKLSVDTEEDLARVRAEFERVRKVLEIAEAKSGKRHVHKV